MSYHIRRRKTGSGDAYCLVDSEGAVLPHQVETVLRSSASESPTFVVTFYAGKLGLRVVDEDEAD